MNKKKVIKKKTVRQLEKELKEMGERAESQRQLYLKIYQENQELKQKLQARLDDRQLEQRNKLASSLGHMIEATSKAVMYIIGKEVV